MTHRSPTWSEDYWGQKEEEWLDQKASEIMAEIQHKDDSVRKFFLTALCAMLAWIPVLLLMWWMWR
jgi:hypothetical protein